jgi:hypothetical protein
MTKCLKKRCFKLSEAANTWGIFPRCGELGRAVAYFEIVLTLGLKPQACTKIYILFIGVMRGCLRLFSYHIFCCNELEIYLQGSNQRDLQNEAQASILWCICRP